MPVHYHNSPPQLNSACSMWWLVYIHFAAYTLAFQEKVYLHTPMHY